MGAAALWKELLAAQHRSTSVLLQSPAHCRRLQGGTYGVNKLVSVAVPWYLLASVVCLRAVARRRDQSSSPRMQAAVRPCKIAATTSKVHGQPYSSVTQSAVRLYAP